MTIKEMIVQFKTQRYQIRCIRGRLDVVTSERY